MKKIKYLLLLLVVFAMGVVSVNAEGLLPYEENIKSITLYTYDGVYTTRKIIQNTYRIKNVLEVISDKKEVEREGLDGTKKTNMEFGYYNGNKIKIVFYESNLIGVIENAQETIYEVNYSGNSEETIIGYFSDIVVNKPGETNNPQTSDNIIIVSALIGIVSIIAIASYRKLKLN